MDVLLSQNCGKILVGDPHQQIYTFRGAVNALRTENHTHIFYLTQVNALSHKKLSVFLFVVLNWMLNAFHLFTVSRTNSVILDNKMLVS